MKKLRARPQFAKANFITYAEISHTCVLRLVSGLYKWKKVRIAFSRNNGVYEH
jgi:hypothetical protein